MACKSCKKTKKMKSDIDGGVDAFQKRVDQRKKEIEFINQNIDPKTLNTSHLERFVLIVFAWIPLGLGYLTIVNWLISLF